MNWSYVEYKLEGQVHKGDHLFYTTLSPHSEDLQASQTMYQRLAEVHQKHLGTGTKIPKHLQGFSNIFLKESFDALPNKKV